MYPQPERWGFTLHLVKRTNVVHTDCRTCSQCFRWIRLKPSDPTLITYHGYNVEQRGFNDFVGQSCNGADYPPFQVSCEGTLAKLKDIRDHQDEAEKGLQYLSTLEQTTKRKNSIQLLELNIKNIKNYRSEALKKISENYPDQLKEAEAL